MRLEQHERDRQRDERERVRWHEREVLRLQIQLERIKRGEMGSTEVGEEEEFDPHRDPGPPGIMTGPSLGSGQNVGSTGGSVGEHQPIQHLQHHLESHERERDDDPRLDLGTTTHHHQSQQQQSQQPQQQTSQQQSHSHLHTPQQHHRHHVHHNMHGTTQTEGISNPGDVSLDALATLRDASAALRS